MTGQFGSPEILYFVKGGTGYGFGHAARCRLFFETLQKRGLGNSAGPSSDRDPLRFLALYRGEAGFLRFFQENGIPVLQTGPDPFSRFRPTETLAALPAARSAVLDFAGVDEEEKKLAAQLARTVILMDDENRSRPHSETCHWIVNGQYLDADPEDPRKKDPRYLLGPDYFFLSPDLLAEKEKPKTHRTPPETVFVGLGGGRNDPLAGTVLRVLADCGIQNVILATGFGKPGGERERPSFPNRLELCSHPSEIAKAMAQADFSVTAGGLMKFESASVGTPPIVIALNEGQAEISRKFEKRGFGRYAGMVSEEGGVPASELTGLVREWMDSPDLMRETGIRGKEGIPGGGLETLRNLAAGSVRGAPDSSENGG